MLCAVPQCETVHILIAVAARMRYTVAERAVVTVTSCGRGCVESVQCEMMRDDAGQCEIMRAVGQTDAAPHIMHFTVGNLQMVGIFDPDSVVIPVA